MSDVQRFHLGSYRPEWVKASDYDALLADRDRLAARTQKDGVTIARLKGELKHAHAELSAARAALQAYGMHHAYCQSNVYLTSNPPKLQPCNCGLDAARAALSARTSLDELHQMDHEDSK